MLPDPSYEKVVIRIAAPHGRHSRISSIRWERGGHMELLATFSHLYLCKRVTTPMGKAAIRDGQTPPAIPAGIHVRVDG